MRKEELVRSIVENLIKKGVVAKVNRTTGEKEMLTMGEAIADILKTKKAESDVKKKCIEPINPLMEEQIDLITEINGLYDKADKLIAKLEMRHVNISPILKNDMDKFLNIEKDISISKGIGKEDLDFYNESWERIAKSLVNINNPDSEEFKKYKAYKEMETILDLIEQL